MNLYHIYRYDTLMIFLLYFPRELLMSFLIVVTDLQTSCNKVVVKPISGCVRTACSQLL